MLCLLDNEWFKSSMIDSRGRFQFSTAMLVERIMVEHVESEIYVDRGPSELGYIIFGELYIVMYG